jgi:hypothetical protein
MDTILWLLAFSFAGYVAGFFLCKRHYTSKVTISIEDTVNTFVDGTIH